MLFIAWTGRDFATMGEVVRKNREEFIVSKEYEEEVVTILIALQHMIRDRQNAVAGAGGGSSS